MTLLQPIACAESLTAQTATAMSSSSVAKAGKAKIPALSDQGLSSRLELILNEAHGARLARHPTELHSHAE